MKGNQEDVKNVFCVNYIDNYYIYIFVTNENKYICDTDQGK